MTWVGVSVAVAFAGLAVLAVCALKVFGAVRRLGRELERTRRRLEPKHRDLTAEMELLRRTGAADQVRDGVRSS